MEISSIRQMYIWYMSTFKNIRRSFVLILTLLCFGSAQLALAQSVSTSSDLNWAGYVAQGGTYTSVSGTWVVPTVTNNSGNNADATWVGIGGTSSHDLIQAGTEALPTSAGALKYQAWMEILPQDSTPVPLAISPGDSVTVSITEGSAGMWFVSFTNTTTGKSYSKEVTYNSSLSSAEWIEEMPVEVGGLLGLDNFGTINFSSGYAIKNGSVVSIAQSGATPLNMQNSSGQLIATPSVLGSDGMSFSVARQAGTATSLAVTSRGIRAVDTVTPSVQPASSYASSGSSHSGGNFRRTRRSGLSGYRIVLSF